MNFTPEQLLAIKVPFLETLGVEYVSHSKGQGSFKLTVEEKHLRTLGLLHGGVSCSLLDTTMGLAAMTCAEDGKVIVTSQMNVHFIRPCRLGETIIVSAHVKHGGRQTVVTEAELKTDTGELVALSTATYMYASA